MQIRMQLSPIPDRRSPNRLAVTACPRCHDALTSVTLRTPYVLYCRCQSCGEIWSMPRTTDEPPIA
jgi:hypothetical protein